MVKQVVLASHNIGKFKEFEQLFSGLDIKIISQKDLGIPAIEETGLTFIENAILKARHACIYSGLPAIADDSGLEVDALQGLPGIYSARFAGNHATQEERINKILSLLSDTKMDQRTARFHCVLVYMQNEKEPAPLISHGIWEGKILYEAIGKNGFGYDPIFFVEAMNCSAAQLSVEQKNQLSHRGQAMKNFIHLLLKDKKTFRVK